MSKFLDSNGLLYVWGKVKTLLNGKVDKVDGKGLSTNDYTDEDKALIATIPTDTEQAEMIEFKAYTEDAIQNLWDSVIV